MRATIASGEEKGSRLAVPGGEGPVPRNLTPGGDAGASESIEHSSEREHEKKNAFNRAKAK